MCSVPIVVKACDKLDIASQSGGLREYYWFPALPVGPRITGIRGYLDIVHIDASTTVDVHGRWSLDGVRWVEFSGGALDTFTSAGLDAMNRYTAKQDFGPQIQLGVSIRDTSASGVVTATLSVTFIFETNGAA